MPTQTLPASTRKIRMSDPGLPSTVSRAAIELDHASRGEKVDLEAIRRFATFLHASLEQPVTTGGHTTTCLDVAAVDVVGHALTEIEGAATVHTVQDILDHAWKIAGEMQTASESNPKMEFARWRRFCIAFGNSLLAHRASLEQEGSLNPYRR